MSRQSDYTKNISYQVYLSLKDKIITIDYKPGDVLKELDIAEEFKLSRTPIRAAIQELKNEGFVEFNNKNIVTPMSLNDYIKIFQIRENLELLSVKLATLNWNEENILALEENCQLQKKSLYKKGYQPLKFLNLDRQFHLSMAKISGNNFLVEELKRFYDLFYRYNYICGFENRKDYAIVEHENLISMIKNGNMGLAMKQMKDHMTNVNSLIIMSLPEKLNKLSTLPKNNDSKHIV